MKSFTLTQSTEIILSKMEQHRITEPIKRAVERFRRDMDKVLIKDENRKKGGKLFLFRKDMTPEKYQIQVEEEAVIITAGDELGFVYALLFMSERYLGIRPFWFWNDQIIKRRRQIKIPVGSQASPEYRVRYRGWFINDEVLISNWDAGVAASYPWEMVFEALLRLGGNMVIPGTDKNAAEYAPLASSMGLIITHHHAEPLGAEMFARVYPELNPSYTEHGDLFRELWKDGIMRQKDSRIIWNIGFRGQGDRPFWEDDTNYDTPQKRGLLISKIIKEQYDMVRAEVPDAVFCTNLYGEIMELYQQGFLSIPEDVIMIWADNGYGKMVSRRQGNNNPRISALPSKHLQDRMHGTYYHVSFYDLQAANHITMLPNSMEFVEKELNSAYINGIRQFWLINASNIKPHVYPLDFIANLWREENLSAEEHRRKYLQEYYGYFQPEADGQILLDKMEDCLRDYARCTIAYGNNEDEHAGEQFYNYVTRHFAHSWMKNGGSLPCEGLFWCVKRESYMEQIAWYKKKCEEGIKTFSQLEKKCELVSSHIKKKQVQELWKDSVELQVKLHLHCLQGTLYFCKAYEKYEKKVYIDAFYLLGKAADAYQTADFSMREREHGKWKGFYANECLTDIKETAYILRQLMGYVRNIGDGPDFYSWQRETIYAEKDRRVMLITNMENHLTNEELYQAMCRNT